MSVDVAVIIPVKNGEVFIQETFDAILRQTSLSQNITLEICVYDDGSEDETWRILSTFTEKLDERKIGFKRARGLSSKGVGFAKNRAVELSSAKYLCFCDVDDVSSPNRILEQFNEAENLAKDGRLVFLGSQFHRLPPGSTARYTNWANKLNDEEIKTQVYTSHGPTLVAPTWFISRSIFETVTKFNEEFPRGFPEDLDFFFACLRDKRVIFKKVESDLVMYRYHPGCATLGVSESAIWDLRLGELRRRVLCNWDQFTVWSAGKQGKRFYKSLSGNERSKVTAFCDVDNRKIQRGWHEEFDTETRKITSRVPIIHVKEAHPPLVVCVKLDLTDGDLENLVLESGWIEGRDIVFFG
ncbi:unnamed protein product [Caenorhabditis auriculariae]|uniref:Glycosyltransferase 2-like domain-containing protein n=1 Tax=Caenorhabditis auriculariae TaxID=2777116 RepID=A0A8S1HE54_9PELO|nr:unnamed protein product [Caenorhabditis auriculariae]